MFPSLEWLSLPDEVRVFGDMMQQQIDLRHEARNLSQFEENFGRDGQGGKAGRVHAAVIFPRPLVNWSTDEVLVEEYADAVPLKYFLRHGGGPFDHRIANLGLDAFLVSTEIVWPLVCYSHSRFRICYCWITLSMPICTPEIS